MLRPRIGTQGLGAFGTYRGLGTGVTRVPAQSERFFRSLGKGGSLSWPKVLRQGENSA